MDDASSGVPAPDTPTRHISYDLLRDRAATPVPLSDVSDDEPEEPASDPAPRPPTKKPRVKIEESEEELGNRIQCDNADIVPLLYVPCVNGIVMAGSVAVYSGRDCSVERLEFDGRRKKAFALLKSIEDEDETMRLPAVKVYLKSENFLKNEVFDFYQIDQHPVNQAFAVFSAVKRAVGLSRNRNSHTVTIGPATPLVRQFTGFSSIGPKEIVKFAVAISAGSRGCHGSWDSVLGQRWDVLPGPSGIAESMDTVVKSIRFQEHREFGIIHNPMYHQHNRGPILSRRRLSFPPASQHA